MRTIKLLMYVFVLSLIAVSCSEDDPNIFEGDVSVTLISKGSSEVIEGEAADFTYDVVLNKSFDKAITLTFELDKLANYPNILSISNPVIIPKNQTKSTLKIKALKKPDIDNVLNEDTNFKISLKSYKGITNKLLLASNYLITVKKEEGFTPLTQEQKEMLATYKSKGIDLSMWIGKIPFKVTVKTGANGYAAFENSEEKQYSGITHITLSNNATKDKPLLKMVNNAFGLNEYLQWVFRNETILNTEYWYNPSNEYVNPAGKKVLKALGEDKVQKWINKEYSFNVVVDDIEVKADNTIIFVSENNAYENEENFMTMKDYEGKTLEKKFSGIDFEYEFPLWDEFKKIAKGNDDLIQQASATGSIHPNFYIGERGVLKDEWEESNWVAPTGTYNSKEMKFKFNSDHLSSGDYDVINVTLTAK